MPLGPLQYLTAPYTLDTASFNNEFVNLSSGGLDCVQWFHPTACGTVTHVELLLFKTGTPDEKPVDVEIWRCGSEATYNTGPYSENGWTKLAACQIFPSSIQDISINSPCNSRWHRILIDSAFWIDDRGGSWLNAASMDGMNLARSVLHGYAVKLIRTAANSDGGANGFVRMPHAAVQNWNSIFGGRTNTGSSNATRGGTSAGVPDFPINIIGYQQVNSLYQDAPIRVHAQSGYSHRFSVTSHVGDVNVSSGIFQKRGAPFMAVGSKVTRVMFPLLLDGANSGDHSNYASLWTFDQNSGIPGTCLGSTSILRWGQGGLPTSDLNDRETAWMFVFSGGINVTSGNIYVAALETWAASASTTRLTKWPSYATDVQSLRRFFWDSRSPDLSGPGNAWGIASGFTHMFEVWYVDSATNAGLVDVASTPSQVFSNQNYIYTNSHTLGELMGVASYAGEFFRYGKTYGFARNGICGPTHGGIQYFFPTECGTVTHVDLFIYNNLHSPRGFSIEFFTNTASANNFHCPNVNSGWELMSTGSVNPASVEGGWYNRGWHRFPVDPFFVDNGPAGRYTTSRSATGMRNHVYAMVLRADGANSFNSGTYAIRAPGEASIGTWNADFSAGFGALTVNTLFYGEFIRQDLMFRLVGSVQANSVWKDRPLHTVQRSTAWPMKVSSLRNEQLAQTSTYVFREAQKFYAVGSAITRIILSGWTDSVVEEIFCIKIWSHDVTSDCPSSVIHSGDYLMRTGGGTLWSGDIDDAEQNYAMTFNGTSGVIVQSGQPYWYSIEAASGTIRGGANAEQGVNLAHIGSLHTGFRHTVHASYLTSNSFWSETGDIGRCLAALIYYRDADTEANFPGMGGGGVSSPAPFRRGFPNTRRRIDPVDLEAREFPLD